MGRWRVLAMVGLTAMAAGCASGRHAEGMIPPPPPPPPAGYHVNGTGPVTPPSHPVGSTGAAAPASATTAQGTTVVRSGHRQYFDQRRKRYYYFDPARRAYYWEDGTPKG